MYMLYVNKISIKLENKQTTKLKTRIDTKPGADDNSWGFFLEELMVEKSVTL